VKTFDDTSSCFDTMPECDEWTDRNTHGIAVAISRTRLIASSNYNNLNN